MKNLKRFLPNKIHKTSKKKKKNVQKIIIKDSSYRSDGGRGLIAAHQTKRLLVPPGAYIYVGAKSAALLQRLK